MKVSKMNRKKHWYQDYADIGKPWDNQKERAEQRRSTIACIIACAATAALYTWIFFFSPFKDPAWGWLGIEAVGGSVALLVGGFFWFTRHWDSDGKPKSK